MDWSVYVIISAIVIGVLGAIWALNRAASRARPLTAEEAEQARIESQVFSL